MDSEQAWWRRVAEGLRIELITQRRKVGDLAEVLGRGRNYVSRRVNGREPFQMDEIETAAKWLGVEVSDLAVGEKR